MDQRRNNMKKPKENDENKKSTEGFLMRKIALCLLIFITMLVLTTALAETDRSITITSDSNIVFAKKQLKLQAEVNNLYDSVSSKTKIVWESDHPEVAKVNNGTVSGVSPGKATIKASAKDNPGIFATYDVEVRVPVKTIKADPTRIQMYVGEKQKDETNLVVTVLPEDAYYKEVVMASTDENVITVDSSGKITAIGPGKAKITVTSTEPGCKAKAVVNVTVKEYVDKIVIEDNNVTIAEKKSKTAKAIIEPKTAANKKLQWVSADENVAKVSNKGQITGVACGTTTINVISADTGKVSETINVTVIKEIKKIVVDNTKLALQSSDDTWEQKITIIPEDATYQNLEWKSSDEKIATVDSTGKITPIAAGKCTITGTAQDGYNAKVKVSVKVKNPTPEAGARLKNDAGVIGKIIVPAEVFFPKDINESKDLKKQIRANQKSDSGKRSVDVVYPDYRLYAFYNSVTGRLSNEDDIQLDNNRIEKKVGFRLIASYNHQDQKINRCFVMKNWQEGGASIELMDYYYPNGRYSLSRQVSTKENDEIYYFDTNETERNFAGSEESVHIPANEWMHIIVADGQIITNEKCSDPPYSDMTPNIQIIGKLNVLNYPRSVEVE